MNEHLETGKTAGVLAWYGSDVRHPAQVVRDPFLTTEQKREFLADWASDRRAVPNEPDFRLSATGALADIDDILSALKKLDGMTGGFHPMRPRRLRDVLPRCSRLLIGEAIRVRRRPRRDDDDPPPAPAAARVPRPPTSPRLGAAIVGERELCHA